MHRQRPLDPCQAAWASVITRLCGVMTLVPHVPQEQLPAPDAVAARAPSLPASLAVCLVSAPMIAKRVCTDGL